MKQRFNYTHGHNGLEAIFCNLSLIFALMDLALASTSHVSLK